MSAAQPANANRAPDPFIERIGSGYAERTFREQWTELEALLQEELRRTRSEPDRLGPVEAHAADQAEEYLRKMAMLMPFMLGELEAVDESLRDAAAKVISGEGTETCVDYGVRVLRDHWAQLKGRLNADLEQLRSSYCLYGRISPLRDSLAGRLKVDAEDANYRLRQANMLMKCFVFAGMEAVDECLGNAGADFLAHSHRSAGRTAQRKGRSQKPTQKAMKPRK